MTQNAVAATRGGVPATVGDNPWTRFASESGSGGINFLKFNGNTGEYSYGSPVKTLAVDTECAVDMRIGVRKGWICWKEGKVVDEIMVVITEGNPPARHQLQDHGPYSKTEDGWKEQASLQLRDLATGDEFEFKTTSKSGIRAIGGLCKAYGAEFRDHDPEDLVVVTLGSNSFIPKDKSYGRKHAPVLEIVEWLTPDQADEIFGSEEGEPEPAPEPTPAPREERRPRRETARQAAPQVEDEGVAPTEDEEIPTIRQAPAATASRAERRTGRAAKRY